MHTPVNIFPPPSEREWSLWKDIKSPVLNFGYFQVFKYLCFICSSSAIFRNIFFGFKLTGGGITGGHTTSGSVHPDYFGFPNLLNGLGSGTYPLKYVDLLKGSLILFGRYTFYNFCILSIINFLFVWKFKKI